MAKCPYCAEEIQEEAIKCKHCGEFIVRNKDVTFDFEKEKYGMLLIAAPILASIAAYLVWGSSKDSTVYVNLTAVYVVNVLLTAYMVFLESKNSGNSRPVEHVFGFLLFWPIAYPYYMYYRKSYGLKNLAVLGSIASIIFIGTLFWLHIEHQRLNQYFDELRRGLGGF